MSRVAALIAVALLSAGCGLFGDNNVFDLAVGTCFNDEGALDAGEVTSVPVVDCAEPHDNEVYAAFDLADGDWPGATAVEEDAVDGCLSRFDAFVGRAYEESELDFTFLSPTEDSWNRLDDREVVCAVYRLDREQVTGSMEGSGI